MLELMGLAMVVILFCALTGGLFGVVWVRGRIQEASVVGALQETLDNVEAAVLESTPEAEWYHPLEADLLCSEFRDLGASPVGRFSIPEIDNICLHGYILSDPPAYVTINDHPDYGCWTDIVMLPQAGGSLTLTTVAQSGTSSPRPVEHELEFFHVSTHPVSMRGYARAHTMSADFKEPVADEFAAIFNAIMVDCQEALAEQDINQAMLESLVKDSGIVLSGDEAHTINAERQVHRHEQTLKQVMQNYASNSGLSAEDWEQQRGGLLVVYDSMPPTLLVEMLYERLDVPEGLEGELASLEYEDAPARHLAGRFIALLPQVDSIDCIMTVSEPVLADIYKIPELTVSNRKAA